MEKSALNPVFCTELSELNSILSVLSSEVIGTGRSDPQKIPCTVASAPTPLLTRTESYSHSCCKI